MTAFRQVVLEHFRRPHNRATLGDATHEAEGANPLCGDRIRVQLKLNDGRIVDARFTADACAICIAAASLLTDAAQGRAVPEVAGLDLEWLNQALGGEAPPGRKKCVTLPLDTLKRALSEGARR